MDGIRSKEAPSDIEAAIHAALLRAPSDAILGLATASGAGAIVAASIVREAPRVALIEPAHPIAVSAGGFVVFAVALVVGVAAVACVVRTVRS